MKKSEEIKKIIESVSQEDIKRKIKNRQIFIIGDVYKIHGPIVNIDKKEIKIDDLEKTIGDSKRVEKIKENLTDLVLSDEEIQKEFSKFSPENQKSYITDTVSGTASVGILVPSQLNFLEEGVVLPEYRKDTIVYPLKNRERAETIKFSQVGEDNIIINLSKIKKEKWHTSWWGQIIIGLLITVIGGLIIYYLIYYFTK